MSAAVAQISMRASYSLIVAQGERKGKRYKLAAHKITIGRASENDISVEHDVKVSRHHATIEYGAQGYEVKSMNDKNPVLVNGKETMHALLHSGTTLQMGETQFLFEVEVQQPDRALDLHVAPQPPAPNRPHKNSKKRAGAHKKQSPAFKIAIGVVVVFMLWILTSEPSKKDEAVEISSAQDIEAEIEAANQIEKAKLQEAQLSQQNTVQYQDAQANYVRGFRDYKKGQYGRARDAFQTCLSLFPEHVLCNRYLNLSTRKFNEMIQYNTILGRDHRDRNQFRACMNSFKTVMVMLKDQNSKVYQQAKANYDACSAQLGERF
jgi:pSer/pThr/pTyr-binding forkhead associated (FHA) protein